jgi:hypothetical protein
MRERLFSKKESTQRIHTRRMRKPRGIRVGVHTPNTTYKRDTLGLGPDHGVLDAPYH